MDVDMNVDLIAAKVGAFKCELCGNRTFFIDDEAVIKGGVEGFCTRVMCSDIHCNQVYLLSWKRTDPG
jgi:hypothetical protein